MASASNSKTIYSSGSTQPWTLTTAFNETGTSNTNNTSTITVTATIGATGTKFSTNKNNSLKIYWYDNNENTAGILVAERIIQSTDYNVTYTATDSITVKHKTDGTLSGYALTTWTKASSSGNYVPNSDNVQTANTALTSIPRTSTLNSLSISIATNGNSVTVTPNITKYSSSYYDTLYLISGNQYISFGGVTSGTAKSLTSSQINTLYGWFGTSTSITLDAYVQTKTSSSGTDIGTSAKVAVIATLPSYNLSASITATDNVTTYNTYKNIANDLIANLSQPNLVFLAASSTGSTYGRPITHTINNEASTSPKTINNYTGGNFTLVSTDGRKTATVTTSNTVIPYQRPTISCKLERTSSTSDTASVTITGKYYDGNGLKTSSLLTRSVLLKYTETDETEQTVSNFTINETTSNHIVSYTATATLTGLDYKKGINYTAVISDLIGVTNDANGSIPQGQPVWNAYRDSNGTNHMVINGVLSSYSGEIPLPKPYIVVQTNSSTQSISSTTWSKVAFSTYYQKGDIFTFDAINNVIVIPIGVKRIRVWGSVGGAGAAWVCVSTGSDVSASSRTTTQVLAQPSGNAYWASSIPIGDIDIQASTSPKYVGLQALAYNTNTFSLNSGISSTTRLYVELLELY